MREFNLINTETLIDDFNRKATPSQHIEYHIPLLWCVVY